MTKVLTAREARLDKLRKDCLAADRDAHICESFAKKRICIMALQIAFVPHGGGPLPLMNDPNHASLVKWLKGFSAGRTRPSAILIVSAHYETMTPTLTSSAQPSLYFDYYGFPEETYRYAYPAPGAPDLAAEIAEALTD